MPWLFEHAKGGPRLAKAAAATAARVAIPWVFWDRVALHHRVVTWRLVLWLALLTVGLHLLSAGLGIAARLIWASTIGMLLSFIRGEPKWWIDLLTFPIASCGEKMYWNGGAWVTGWTILPFPGAMWPLAGVGVALAWIAMILVIPQTRRRAKVHSRHVLRATVYGLSWLGLFEAARVIDFGREVIALSLSGARTPYPYAHIAMLSPAAAVCLVLWSAAWWHAVLSRGWKIPHATRVWAVLLIPTVLTGAVLWCVGYAYL